MARYFRKTLSHLTSKADNTTTTKVVPLSSMMGIDACRIALKASQLLKSLYRCQLMTTASLCVGPRHLTTPKVTCGTVSFKSQPWNSTRAFSSENDRAPELTHRPSDFDKRILVWSKTYPSKSSIPDVIPHGKMKRAKDEFRIRVNLWMAAATVVGCVLMIYLGKKDAREGKSVEKENLLWHQSIKEQEGKERPT